MVFPQYKDKHLHAALFNAKDYVAYNHRGARCPGAVIIMYDSELMQRTRRRYALKPIRHKSHAYDLYTINGVGVVHMKGIGAPHAVGFAEDLIARGAKRFISIGTAGGLFQEGVFLCDKALRDEGTSHHYVHHGKYSHPDKKLTSSLGKCMAEQGIAFQRKPTWTIDAPYRETKKEVARYTKEGIATVEMEASALFALGTVRKVKMAAAFAVSDVLGRKWDPRFKHINLKRSLDSLFDAALDCLRS